MMQGCGLPDVIATSARYPGITGVTFRGTFKPADPAAVAGIVSSPRLDAGWCRVEAPTVARIRVRHDRPELLLRTDAGAPALIDGVPLAPATIVACAAGGGYYLRTTRPSAWATIALAPATAHLLCPALAEEAAKAASDFLLFSPPQSLRERLLAVHGGLLRQIAPDAPEANDTGFDGVVLDLVQACLALGPKQMRTNGARKSMLDCLEDLIERNRDRSISMEDSCAEIGVADRTLRACCQTLIGMGPSQYMYRRRMALARRALLDADPRVESVTSIAGRYGFWELGRFAVSYKGLFGESPSATLRARPEDAPFPFERWGIMALRGPDAVPAPDAPEPRQYRPGRPASPAYCPTARV